MSSSCVLPRPARPLHDESVASLVMRNARVCGLNNPMLVLTPLKMEKGTLENLPKNQPDVALATLLNIEMTTLSKMSSWSESPATACVGGHQVQRTFLQFVVRRSCPMCLAESLHHRALWDIVALRACPHHGCMLTSSCPGCGKAPRWFGNRLEFCGNDGCFFDLRQAGPSGHERMPAHVLGLGKLYDGGPDALLPGFPFGFGKALSVVYTLGSHVRRVGNMGRSDSFLQRHPEQAAEIMESGWGTLLEWPNGFHSMLDGLRDKSACRGGRFGLRHEFGGIAKWLSDHADAGWALPFREAFTVYLAGQSGLRVTAAGLRRFGSPAQLRNRHMTVNDAAAFLGVSQETMVELADRDELYLVHPSGSGVPSLLRADMVHELKDRKRGTLLRHEAAAILGVGLPVLARILTSGLLSAVNPERRVTHFRDLKRGEIEEVVRRALSSLEVIPPRGKLVPLMSCMSGRQNTVDVLEAVMDGRLRARGTRPGQPGLRGLLFDSQDLTDLFSPNVDTVSLASIAGRWGVDITSVRHWAREGYLVTGRSSSRHEQGTRVTEEGIRAFERDFITGVEVGKLASTKKSWAARRLKFFGFSSLPSASLTKLYRRADMTPQVVARIGQASTGRAEAVAAANEVVKRIGREMVLRVGCDLRREENGFSAPTGGTYVQVLVGRRQSVCSSYVFRLNPRMRRKLAAAREGWLVLAVTGFDTYCLASWAAAENWVGPATGQRQVIRVAVDGQGKVQDVRLEGTQQWLHAPTKTQDACVSDRPGSGRRHAQLVAA